MALIKLDICEIQIKSVEMCFLFHKKALNYGRGYLPEPFRQIRQIFSTSIFYTAVYTFEVYLTEVYVAAVPALYKTEFLKIGFLFRNHIKE